MKIFKMCKSYLFNYKYELITYVFLNFITSFLSIITPYLTGSFLDHLIVAKDINIIYKFCIRLLGLFISMFILGYLANRIYTKVQVKMSFEFNRDIVLHVQRTSLLYTNDLDYAYYAQLINNDVNSLITFCVTVIQSVVVNLLTLLITFVIAFNLNSKITISIIIFIFLYVIFYYLFKKNLYQINKEISENQSVYFSTLFEQFSLLKFIKINSLYEAMHNRLKKSFDIVSDSLLRGQKHNYIFASLDSLITTTAHIYIYFIGGLSILKGEFTIGMFTIFLNYFTMILGSVRYFYNFGNQYQDKLVSYDRLQDILNQTKENNGNINLDKVNRIEIENLSFKYKEREDIIKKVCLELTIGNIYCILGSNGSGKSTLLDLIAGCYVGEKRGSIRYNSDDIDNINMINDTIKYNILLEERDFNNSEKKQLEKLARIIGFEDFISKSADGYNTIISEMGNNISGGERKKITLLRSLVKHSQILMLDEPTAALDQKSIKDLKEYLLTIKENKIIIIATHDREIIDIADYIYIIDELINCHVHPCLQWLNIRT